jgi:hypothetical protein
VSPLAWFLAIDVDSIESVVGELRRRGVQVGHIEDVPHGKAAKFTDPERNVVEVHESIVR